MAELTQGMRIISHRTSGERPEFHVATCEVFIQSTRRVEQMPLVFRSLASRTAQSTGGFASAPRTDGASEYSPPPSSRDSWRRSEAAEHMHRACPWSSSLPS